MSNKNQAQEMSADNVKKAFRALAEASGYAVAVKAKDGQDGEPERAPNPEIMQELKDAGVFD